MGKSYTWILEELLLRLTAVFGATLFLVAEVLAAPTGSIVFTGNILQALRPAGYLPEPESFADLDASPHFGKREIMVRDTQDVEHLVRIYCYHLTPTAGNVSVRMFVDGEEINGGKGKPKSIGGGLLFVGEDGMHLGSPLPFVTTDPIPWSSGGPPQLIRLDFSQLYFAYDIPIDYTATVLPVGVDTTQVNLAGNLDPRLPLVGAVDSSSFAGLESSAQYSLVAKVADSTGVEHQARVYFFHESVNRWRVKGYLDGGDVSGGIVGSPVQIFSLLNTFDKNGISVPVAATVIADKIDWANGAADQRVLFRLSPITQFYSRSFIFSFPYPEPAATPTPTPTPTATATPTPAPPSTPSAGDCTTLNSCLSSNLDAAMNSCQLQANLCSKPANEFLTTAETLSQRAITVAKCKDKKRGRACRRCYARAARLLTSRKERALFHGLLGEARELVRATGSSVCR